MGDYYWLMLALSAFAGAGIVLGACGLAVVAMGFLRRRRDAGGGGSAFGDDGDLETDGDAPGGLWG